MFSVKFSGKMAIAIYNLTSSVDALKILWQKFCSIKCRSLYYSFIYYLLFIMTIPAFITVYAAFEWSQHVLPEHS